ncbi:unnamed protein product, partial [Effrenium voratum]
MCQYLRIPNMGPVHSGIADTRNVARILLALWQEGAVCQLARKRVKEKPRPSLEAARKAFVGSSRSSQTLDTFREALVILLARVPAEEAALIMKELHLSRAEQRFVKEHVLCLGRSPAAEDAGAIRRFVVA